MSGAEAEPNWRGHPPASLNGASDHVDDSVWQTVTRGRSRAGTQRRDTPPLGNELGRPLVESPPTAPASAVDLKVAQPVAASPTQLPSPRLSPLPEALNEHIQDGGQGGDGKSGANLSEGAKDSSIFDRRPSIRKGQMGNGAIYEKTNGLNAAPEHRQPSPPSRSMAEKDKTLKLSPEKIEELTTSPDSLALRVAPEADPTQDVPPFGVHIQSSLGRHCTGSDEPRRPSTNQKLRGRRRAGSDAISSTVPTSGEFGPALPQLPVTPKQGSMQKTSGATRPLFAYRTVSTPPSMRNGSAKLGDDSSEQESRPAKSHRTLPTPLRVDPSDHPSAHRSAASKPPTSPDPSPSPMPQSIPLPPLSIPTYLQLELSSSQPSPLYIHRSLTSDFPYESSRIKFERLLNFLLLPPQLEQVLWFGALACLDSWLYTFTILPLRFFKALTVLCQWWGSTLAKEARDVTRYIYWGAGRMWRRRRGVSVPSTPTSSDEKPRARRPSVTINTPQQPRSTRTATFENGTTSHHRLSADRKSSRTSAQRHRRTKSTPSALLPDHKADILKGMVVLFSCMLLMRFDASRMYHSIRGQAAIKLYVIYNVLEVCDRLLSALGQDVFECLFSKETLERKPDGRSKVLRPFGMFLLALTYNVVHSTALFYQVMTLNVAVNSYSNALTTLLMSNQFVEIKSTVFKKFEKENLFQLTCADVVERFQLWLMLLIIALRNIVEVGGLSLSSSTSAAGSSSSQGSNSSFTSPLGSGGIIPKSFTIFPKWTGQVLGPFLLVLGSEMLVDWLKHAYITKFNTTKPVIYGRFLDVLAKDYYSNAFGDQNLTRRLGLPVIPLSCLFIRASLQTYHMFLATNMPLPIPSTATSLSVDSATTSPATTAALQHFDAIVRRALGRSSFGAGGSSPSSDATTWWTTDDVIAFITMLLFFSGVFLILLACKLVLGMVLLGFARGRYKGMKERERQDVGTGGRRIGGWGVVEVDDDKKRWIYQDDPEGAKAAREREKAMRERQERWDAGLSGVRRYSMAAKRIW
ncbi:MAG: hypothetical protein M1833_006359 [Piccolia ochrophora]|nr:MAG: hypothetical protein M1833_006359 [Piccolia ochrophora]